MASTLHVTPRKDVIVHDTSSEEPDCVCGPATHPVVRDDGSVAWLLVHHSLDGRESAQEAR